MGIWRLNQVELNCMLVRKEVVLVWILCQISRQAEVSTSQDRSRSVTAREFGFRNVSQQQQPEANEVQYNTPVTM